MAKGYKIFPRGKAYRDNFDQTFTASCSLCGCPVDGNFRICESCRIELRNEEYGEGETKGITK